MTTWHTHVIHMAKHMKMVGGPGPPSKSGAVCAHMYNVTVCGHTVGNVSLDM